MLFKGALRNKCHGVMMKEERMGTGEVCWNGLKSTGHKERIHEVRDGQKGFMEP